jgi:hypothetical protein
MTTKALREYTWEEINQVFMKVASNAANNIGFITA